MNSSLANLLQAPSLAPTKLDELKIKLNILSSFVERKVEEFKEVKNELFEDDDQIVLGKKSEL